MQHSPQKLNFIHNRDAELSRTIELTARLFAGENEISPFRYRARNLATGQANSFRRRFAA